MVMGALPWLQLGGAGGRGRGSGPKAEAGTKKDAKDTTDLECQLWTLHSSAKHVGDAQTPEVVGRAAWLAAKEPIHRAKAIPGAQAPAHAPKPTPSPRRWSRHLPSRTPRRFGRL